LRPQPGPPLYALAAAGAVVAAADVAAGAVVPAGAVVAAGAVVPAGVVAAAAAVVVAADVLELFLLLPQATRSSAPTTAAAMNRRAIKSPLLFVRATR